MPRSKIKKNAICNNEKRKGRDCKRKRIQRRDLDLVKMRRRRIEAWWKFKQIEIRVWPIRQNRPPTAYDFPQIRGPLNETGNSEGFLKRISLSPSTVAHPSTSIVRRYDHRKIIDQTRERRGVVTLLIIHSCHDKRDHDGYAAAEGVDTPLL